MELSEAQTRLAEVKSAYSLALGGAEVAFADGRRVTHQDIDQLRRELAYWEGRVSELSGSSPSRVMRASWR